MSFAERVARMQEAVFRTLGEDATWSGVEPDVRVRFREQDGVEGFGGSQILIAETYIMVRRSQVPSPAVGDVVTLRASELSYRVTADPTIDRKGRWTCVVTPL